jgi:cobalt-zinc-cadmium efflux system outer membrane protein
VAASGVVERARGTARVGAAISNPTAQLETDRLAPTSKLMVVQPLGWLPRRGAELAAGRAMVERARADSAQTLADVARDVRRSFFGALAARRQWVLAAEQSTLADSLAGLATRRAAAGDISDLERAQIALEAARARLGTAQAREAERVAREELARAVAWSGPTAPIATGPLDAGLDAGLDAVAGDPTGDDRVVGSLPMVRGPVADSRAAAARLRSARIARIPIPGLVVGREIGGDSRRNVILGVALPVPLWSQGGEAVEQARGAAAEQAALAAEARLTAGSLLRSTRARADESRLRARVARDSLLPEAQRIRGGAVQLYEAGRTSLLAVLEALRSERDVARATFAELLAFQEARADLGAVLGEAP